MEEDRCLAGHMPTLFHFYRTHSTTAVPRILGREHRLPDTSFGRGQEWLRYDLVVEVSPEIDQQEPVVAMPAAFLAEEAECKGLRTQDGTVDAAVAPRSERRVFTTEA
jgi:hypothetical protein